MKSFDLKKFIISFLLCQGAGMIGSIFTVSAIPLWYATLEKPALNPPSWVFGPAWLLLYTLMAFSIYFIWEKGLKSSENKFIFYFFMAHLAVNALWSIFFFGMRNPLLALSDIVLMWMMIIVLIFKFYKVKRLSSYLFIPYLLWVTFATYLNYSVWMLNF
ncbi:TspO protein [Candidatus Falkowbacteria bacterium RIFOXYB2_FULL_38_15]|uniref:TspO protein n=1 Tax=Candidatus Falkowbacteria bacterium RIFOXYA2_FULL_38_12 TaxID=1797993 RepID=A0A1F5S1P7_9BACT|nr:MAG: TspO protein [Candidatus Falkowbacteria bacterium RIFOXYA2_FULL_38_12]OGF32865.1 MAG: TspO protein [Candidatus Falkowbacteria bacterium RIFOXYB2_FULL_38_15]OGF44001.1 MAG: TspO protein [Candidatus Falkowbacteria bacterium RIFOXYD2_FULL_39_16]